MMHYHLTLNLGSADQMSPAVGDSASRTTQSPTILPSPPNTQQSPQSSIPQASSGLSSGPMLSTSSARDQNNVTAPSPSAGTSDAQTPQSAILECPLSANEPQSKREAYWLA